MTSFCVCLFLNIQSKGQGQDFFCTAKEAAGNQLLEWLSAAGDRGRVRIMRFAARGAIYLFLQNSE